MTCHHITQSATTRNDVFDFAAAAVGPVFLANISFSSCLLRLTLSLSVHVDLRDVM